MENSGKILFGDDKAEWFVAVGERWIGPLKPSEVNEKIQSHQISWAHYGWRKGHPESKRLCDVRAFQLMLPRQPTTQPSPANLKAVPQVRKAPPPIRDWFLHDLGSQYGPFSQDELQRFLTSGRVHPEVFAWRQGMGTWQRLSEIEGFSDFARHSLKTPEKTSAKKAAKQGGTKKEKRMAPRFPLLAKIMIAGDQVRNAGDQNVIVGVCRDISVGGLQVLTDSIPAEVGAVLKMNISPSSGVAGGSPENRIEPFVAEGMIVRILEDGRGFSFRFKKLGERARNAIEAYIESSK